MKNYVFWIFALLQNICLGLIIFLLFQALQNISPAAGPGPDTQILLSVLFPVFLLIVEYIIYNKIAEEKNS